MIHDVLFITAGVEHYKEKAIKQVKAKTRAQKRQRQGLQRGDNKWQRSLRK